MAQITNRFKMLLAQIEAETGVRPTYEDVQKETGIAISTLSSYGRGTVTRYDEKTVMALVDFFNKRLEGGVTVGDLLEYPPENGQDKTATGVTEVALAA